MRIAVSVWLFVIAVNCAISAFVWPYAINFWLVFSDREPVIVWWHGVLIGLCPGLGQLGIPAAIMTFILSLIL